MPGALLHSKANKKKCLPIRQRERGRLSNQAKDPKASFTRVNAYDTIEPCPYFAMIFSKISSHLVAACLAFRAESSAAAAAFSARKAASSAL